jgi:hypothetical protein
MGKARQFGKRLRPLRGLRIAGIAAQDASLDAMENRGQTEVVEGQIEVPIVDAGPPGPSAIGRDVILSRGKPSATGSAPPSPATISGGIE